MISGSKRPWVGTAKVRVEGASKGIATPKIRAIVRGRPTNRILFINQYYWPDNASTAQHLADLAESLAARGHECHVLCGRGRYKPGEPALPAEESRNGVAIHRVAATSLGRRSTLSRMIDYLSFYSRAAMAAIRMPRPDVVVTLTTPPIIGLVGTILRRLKGSRHIYWSMDLHPDAGIALGRMSPKNPVVAALAKLSNFVYRKADRVVTLGPYMADRVESKGVRAGRVAEIPVWSRADEVYPLPRIGHPLRERLGLADRFVVIYSGNLGLAHSSDEFVEAARRLADRPEIVFLFVGDGPRLAEVKKAKRDERLENVRFLDYFPREELHASLSMADLHLISLRRAMTGLVVPGKLYGIMASGRPAVFVGPDHCETADTIRESACGITVRLGDSAGLVAAIERLAADRDEAEAMGERGRSAFLESFERDTCCDQWARIVAEALGESAMSPSLVDSTADLA